MATASPHPLAKDRLNQPSDGSRKAVLAAAALVAFVALLAHGPSRSGRFLSGDDERLILNHYLVNHPSPQNTWTLISKITDDLYQPLPMISFQLNSALAGPDLSGRFPISPRGFHLVNIVLHTLNSVLVLVLVRRLTRCTRVGALAALLFACHPYAVEAVAWINGRMVLMATTFSLVTLIACMADRPLTAGNWGASILAWIAALLSKVMPTVPLVAAWWRQQTCGGLRRRDVWLFGLLLAMAGAAAGLAVAATINAVGPDVNAADGSTRAGIKALLAFRYYVENYFWPSRNSAWSPPPQGTSAISGPSLIALAQCAGFGVLMLLARRFNRAAWLGLGAFAMLLLPFLVAGATRRFLAADRYMYLPGLGLDVAVASVLVAMFDAVRQRLSSAIAGVTIGAPALAMVAALTITSRALGITWESSVARDQRVVQTYPDEPDAHTQLAKACLFENEPDPALNVIAEARRRWPDDARLAAAAGEVFRARKDWANAERELLSAAEKMPEHVRTQYLLALTLEELGRRPEAVARYRRLVETSAAYLPAITALARCELMEGNEDEAMRLSERALGINPYNVESLRRLAGLLMSRNDDSRALELLERAARIDPTDVTAMAWLHILLVEAGRGSEAARVWLPLVNTQNEETHGWLLWAYDLATPRDQAEMASFLSGPCDEHEFDQWGAAVHALASGDEAAVVRIDARGSLRQPFKTLATEKRRLIVSTIHQLPEPIRNGPAAMYLVARAFLLDGDAVAARRIAEPIAAGPGSGLWRDAAKRLLSEIPATSRSAPR